MNHDKDKGPPLVDRRTVTMPCPVCGHQQNDQRWLEAAYGKQAKEGPTSVPCLLCGAPLRQVVPFHVLCAMPAGWKWEREIDPRARVKEYVYARLVELVEASVKEYVYARLVELVEASVSDDALRVAGPNRAFFKALNALTNQEAREVFNHPVLLVSYGSERVTDLQCAYEAFRANSVVKIG